MVAPGALRKLVHGNLGAGYSRCRLAQRPPDSKKQQSTANFTKKSFAVYLTKREHWLTTPTVDHKYAEDAPRNLDEDTEKQNIASLGC